MKNGFTVLELVVGLVILVVVFVIALITLDNVVDKIRKEQADDSIENYVHAVEKQIIINELNDNKEDDFSTGLYNILDLNNKGVKYRDKKPESGWLLIKDKNVVSYSFVLNGYVISYDGDIYTVDKGITEKEKPNNY